MRFASGHLDEGSRLLSGGGSLQERLLRIVSPDQQGSNRQGKRRNAIAHLALPPRQILPPEVAQQSERCLLPVFRRVRAITNAMNKKKTKSPKPIGQGSVSLRTGASVLPAIPISIDFVGRRTILNDGTSPNSVTLQLTSLLPSGGALNFGKQSYFEVWFDTIAANAKNQKSSDYAYALTTSKAAGNIKFPSTINSGWSIAPNSGKWKIGTLQKAPLKGAVRIGIANIVTGLAPGMTHLYLGYNDIPGYGSGVLVAQLEKSPWLYGSGLPANGEINYGQNVGLGVTEPLNAVDLGERVGQKLAVWQNEKGQKGGDFYGVGVGGPLLELHAGSPTGKKTGTNSAQNARVLISKNGNVGIWTNGNAPQNLLDLGPTTGQKLAVYQTKKGDSFYGLGQSSGVLELHAGSPDVKKTKTSSALNARVLISKTGKVGIWMNGNAPQNLLDLGSTTGQKLAVYQNKKGDSFYGLGQSSELLELHAGSPKESKQQPSNKNAKVLVSGGGNVGIGTAGRSPENLLDLGEGVGQKLAVWQNQSGNEFYGLGINGTNLELHAGSPKVTKTETGEKNAKVLVGKGGNVGIGTGERDTPTPQNLLDLGESNGQKLAVFQSSDQSSFYGLGIGDGTLQLHAHSPRVDAKTNVKIASASDKNAKVLINANGDVIVKGTLWVDGPFRMIKPPHANVEKAKWVYFDGKLDGNMGVVVGLWKSGAPSDSRLKCGVSPIGGALEKIRQLSGVRFRWNNVAKRKLSAGADDVSAGPGATEAENEAVRNEARQQAMQELDGEKVGVLAQEVREVLPEAVTEDAEGHLKVDYGNLVPLLIQSVKELSSKVDELSSQIQEMRPRRVPSRPAPES